MAKPILQISEQGSIQFHFLLMFIHFGANKQRGIQNTTLILYWRLWTWKINLFLFTVMYKIILNNYQVLCEEILLSQLSHSLFNSFWWINKAWPTFDMVMITALIVAERVLCFLLWIGDCKLTMALDQTKEEQKADDAQSCRSTSNVVY